MSDPYLITVITPCHNMNLSLMEKAYLSLNNQTLGFEKIEWLIVMHNSPEEDVNMLREIVGQHQNIMIHLLNDGIRSPASPRNYALDRACGTYIGFLDADDVYMRDTCEKAVSCLHENRAQMAAFRIETESSSGQEVAIDSNILINQAIPCHVINTSNWDSGLFTHGSGLGITSKIYDRRSIDDFGLRFDVEVPFASDTLFNLEFLSKMERFCYLPQLIGYHYYMVGNSVVQKFDKSKKDIILNAKGIKKILSYGISTGLSVNTLMWELLAYQATLMLCSTEFSYQERKGISYMMEPLFHFMTKLKKSKIHSKRVAKYTMIIPTLVLRHPKLIYVFLEIMTSLKIDFKKIVRASLKEM